MTDPDADLAVPSDVDTIVIGGGIIGVCTALSLAQQGVSVALFEKGRIGGEQSSRNWGWCRIMGRAPEEIPLGLESLRLWRGLNQATGEDVGFRQTGIAYLCATEKEAQQQEQWLVHARTYGIETQLLDADQAGHLATGSARSWAAALFTPGDGQAEPGPATLAIAQAARRAGAWIRPQCAVRGLDLQGGRIAGVVTEFGRVRCRNVVVAGGVWSRLLCGNHGLDIPQLKLLGSVLRTAPLKGAPSLPIGAGKLGFRQCRDGGYLIARRGGVIAEITPDSFRLLGEYLPSWRKQRKELRVRLGRRFWDEWRMGRHWSMESPSPFEACRVLDPKPARTVLREACRVAQRDFPAFRDMQVVESWGGLIDATPDGVPLIAPVPAVPGLVLATGFSGHGFGLGPGAGQLVADMISGRPPAIDPHPFRLERFARLARTAFPSGATPGQTAQAA